MADVFTPYEVRRSGGRRGERNTFIGTRICSLLPAQVESLESEYNPAFGALHYWPGVTSPFGAHLREFDCQPWPGDSARWRLVLIYREVEPWKMIRGPHQAVLYAKVSSRMGALRREIDAHPFRVIDGPCDEANRPNQVWRPVIKGSNEMPFPEVDLQVRTASNTMSLPDTADTIGKTNNSVLPNLYNAPQGTLLYRGCEFNGIIITPGWWRIDHNFKYKADGWNDTCEVERFKKVVSRTEVMKETGLSYDPKVYMPTVNWVPVMMVEGGDRQETETRNVHRGEADFSVLNGYLSWYD